MFLIHSPKAEAIHCLAKCVVIIEELDGTRHVKHNLGASAHVQSMDRAWHLGDVIALLALQTTSSALSHTQP